MNTVAIHSHFYSAVAPRRVMSDGTIWKQCECGHWTIESVYPPASMYREDPLAPARGFMWALILSGPLYILLLLLIWCLS